MVAAVADAIAERAVPDILQRVRKLEEPSADGFRRSWIMLFPVGKFTHPEYGTLNFSRARLSEIKANFDQKVRHIDVALDANHDQDKATGWLERVELKDGASDQAGLWGLVRWTPLGEGYLKDQTYRYFSPEFGDWRDPQSGKTYHDVLMGGALTNRPFLKEMPAVQLADISTRAWGSVDKSKLPDSCFLDPKNRRLPIYEGAGPLVDGKYTKRGKLNIHGAEAALAAVHGAHTGTAMSGLPAGTEERLQRLLARYGKGGDGGDAANNKAASGGDMGTTTKMLMGTRSSSAGGLVNAPLGPHDVGGDMSDECEEPEGGAQFDDGGDGDGADDGNGFDQDSNTHGAMTVKSHSHGKYAAHSHDGDGDHSDAELADDGEMAYAEPDESGDDEEKMSRGKSLSGKGSKKATEPRASVITLAEATKRLREVEFKLYERDVDATVQALTAKLPEGRGLSKVFAEKVQKWLLGNGYQLSEGRRGEVLDLLRLALSERALVDTRRLGASFDQEARRTIRQGGSTSVEGGQQVERELSLVETAEMLALQDKKIERGDTLTKLSMADRERYMGLAAAEIGYK